MLPLFSPGDHVRAAIELIDDLEERLLPLLGRDVRREQSPDSKMRLAAQLLRDQRIRGLLHPVMDEPISTSLTLDQLGADGLPQNLVELLSRGADHDSKAR